MSRSPIPLVIADVSAFATALRRGWPASPPGQTEALMLVARAAGYRNHQHLRAENPAAPAPDAAAAARVAEALRAFDAEGVMHRWPRKTSVQRLCLLWFWSRLPGRTDLSEPQVNAILQTGARFGDHALLRRSLIDHKLVKRTPDGRVYRRIEAQPSAEERSLLRTLSERRLAADAAH